MDEDGGRITALREYLGRDTTTSPGCDLYRWLRVKGNDRQVLLNTCNDGYGAAMVGRDDVAVDGGVFRWTRTAGSNWRGSKTLAVDLRSWALVEERYTTMFTPGNVSGEVRVHHARQRAEVRWWAPDCADADPFTGTQPDFVDPWTSRLRYTPVPRLIDPAVDGDGLDPGTCGARASGDGVDGWVTFGPVTTARDAAIRALMVGPRTLLVAVDDDVRATPTDPRRWVADDHLEIWASPEEQPLPADEPWDRWLGGVVPYGTCPAKTPALHQWGVRMRDGEVFAGAGARGATPRATLRAGRDAGGVLRIELPFAPHRLTVVYSDADGAAGQEQLIATSALRFNVADTVGFRGPGVHCAVDGERLVAAPPVFSRTSPGVALLGG